jgi:hypothetical protein
MDWSLFRSILEAVMILAVLPAAAVYLLRIQKRNVEVQRRLLEEKDAALKTAESSLRETENELAALQDRFHAFTEEVAARNRQAWARFLEEESAVVKASHQRGGGVLRERFEGFSERLTSVQRELDGFRSDLLVTYDGFFQEREKSLEARGMPPFVQAEWMSEMETEYREGTSGEVIPFPPKGNGPSDDEDTRP